MDSVTEAFIGETIARETNRSIAAILSDIESMTGKKDPRISQIVKNVLNASKRIMFTQITLTEVEPKDYSHGGKG